MEKRFKSQLAEFRKDDEARWQYETAELERQFAIEKRIGRNDNTERKELEKAGINAKLLDEQSRAWVEKETRAHKEALEIEPPPLATGRKDRIHLDEVAAIVGSHTWLYPPAYDGYGNT